MRPLSIYKTDKKLIQKDYLKKCFSTNNYGIFYLEEANLYKKEYFSTVLSYFQKKNYLYLTLATYYNKFCNIIACLYLTPTNNNNKVKMDKMPRKTIINNNNKKKVLNNNNKLMNNNNKMKKKINKVNNNSKHGVQNN